jgi:hypothetical protein
MINKDIYTREEWPVLGVYDGVLAAEWGLLAFSRDFDCRLDRNSKLY